MGKVRERDEGVARWGHAAWVAHLAQAGERGCAEGGDVLGQ